MGNARLESLEELSTVFEMGVDPRERVLYVVDGIDHDATYRVLAGLRYLNQWDGPITLLLDSPGGETYEAMAIYDAVKASKNPVLIYGTGQVMSAAILVLQAGERRFLSPHCRVLIHDGSWNLGEAHGSVIKATGKEMEICLAIYAKLLADRGGKLTAEQIADLSSKETYLSAQQAIEKGFADEIGTL